MTARSVVEAAALALAVVTAVVAATGMARSRTTYASLHCNGLANIWMPFFVFVAVLAAKSWSVAAVKMLVILAILWLGGPVVTHAIARACRLRAQR